MITTDFGPSKPSIATFYGGYRVPVAIQQVKGSWRGYLLELAGLTAFEFDRVAAELPPGDYSADRLAVLNEAVRLQRKAEYPPVEEYIDAVASDDAAAVAAYKAKYMAVKAAYPMAWDSKAAYKVGDLVSHADKRWKATSDNTGNEPDDVPGDWEALPT